MANYEEPNLFYDGGSRYLFEDGEFKVIVDHYTPRPHLIILNKNFDDQAADLTDSQLRILAEFYDKTRAALSIPEQSIAFSLHCGKWRDREHFHGHIAVDVNWYTALLRRRQYNPIRTGFITRIETNAGGPSCHMLTIAKENKSQDLAEIDTLRRSGCPGGRPNIPGGFRDVWHRSQPLVGFVAEAQQTGGDTLIALVQFASRHLLTGEDSGCHVVLGDVLGATLGERVDGYIVAGPEYYLLLPEEDREAWYTDFQSADAVPVLT